MTKFAYEVEAILAGREKANKKEEFLVKWQGSQKPTWEPLENLRWCPIRLQEFYANFDPTRQVFEVEKILQKKWNRELGQELFLVQWRDYPKSAQTWEPRENLECEELLEEFEERVRMRAARREQRRLEREQALARRPKFTRSGRKIVQRKL